MTTPHSLTTPDNHCTQSSFFLQKKKQTEQNRTQQSRKKSKIKQQQIIRKETNKQAKKQKGALSNNFRPPLFWPVIGKDNGRDGCLLVTAVVE